MSTAPTPERRITPEEYLAIERAAKFKSEYFNGRMYPLHPDEPGDLTRDGISAMAGGTRRHNRICVNPTSHLSTAFRGSPCEVFNSDMRVRVASAGLFTYPDLSAACGNIEFSDETEDVLLNPCVLVEVVSRSTEHRDRGWKFHNYFSIGSLVDYLLVSQDKPFVEHFVRRADGTRMFEFVEGLDATLQLAAVDVAIPLREIYLGVEFGPEEGDKPA
jgi:Uma2 family endonuclease